jgi:hypothetical protein
MEFDDDDFDWAMGELLHLFDRANRLGVQPHHLDPGVFHPAWHVLNEQPFEVRQKAHALLMTVLRQRRAPSAMRWVKLDADALVK